jgi:excisionase family DNA binding protein
VQTEERRPRLATRKTATITVPEAAEWLGVGRNTAYEAAARGEIPMIRIGARVLVPVERLRAMLEDEPSTTRRPER